MRFWKICTQMMTVLLGAMLACSGAAQAIDFSFQGTFLQDDDVQLFTFVVGAPSTVTLRAWSYAGGVNAAGATIARGGFDTNLALFDSTGALIGENDDGGCDLVAADALTGKCWDTYLLLNSLAAGTYTVGIMEFDNSAIGPNLSDGFSRTGDGNFTSGNDGDCAGVAFCDVSHADPGAQRDNHWAFDVNVEQARPQDVPEPSTFALFGVGFLTLLVFNSAN